MEFFKPGRVFDFMGVRWFWIPLSLFLVAASVVLSFYPGPNYGTDFRGGTEVEVAFGKAVDAAGVRAAVAAISVAKARANRAWSIGRRLTWLLKSQ